MLDWYTSIKSKIDDCPTSTCPTCTTFENKKVQATPSTCPTCTTSGEKVGQVGQVDRVQIEKQLLQTGKIQTCTPATNATNATNGENVANVANVARGECEKSNHEPEPWYLKQPKKCHSCIHWKPTGKQRYWCYWIGECILDGQEVSINSKCRFTFTEQSAQQSSEVIQ